MTPSGVTSGFAERRLFAGDAHVVDHDGVVGDGAPHFAVRRGQSRLDERAQHAESRISRSARGTSTGRQICAVPAFLERRARGRRRLLRPPRGHAPARSPRVASIFLASLISAPSSAASRSISSSGSTVNSFRKRRDVGVLGVAPVLPIIVRAHHARHRATPRRRRSCPSWRPRRW